MKLAHGTALLCLISTSLSLAVACGSNDSSGLFSNGGTFSTTTGGSPGSSGGTGATSSAGQPASGGTATTNGGGSNVAGQGSSGTGTGGGNGVAGSTPVGGASTGGGGAGVSNGGAGGGSGGTTTDGGGAGSGSGGTNTSAGAGGTSSTSGGSAGASGSGGSSGSVGVGGSSGGPGMGCPQEKPPQDGGVCAAQTPDNCFYPGEACSCLSDGNTAIKHWGCYGTPNKCPDLVDGLPVNGATCKTFGAGALCPYSSTNYCVCTPTLGGGGGDPKWVCNDPTPQCPNVRPDNNTSCVLPGSAQSSNTSVRECAYADRECFCNGALWTCE